MCRECDMVEVFPVGQSDQLLERFRLQFIVAVHKKHIFPSGSVHSFVAGTANSTIVNADPLDSLILSGIVGKC